MSRRLSGRPVPSFALVPGNRVQALGLHAKPLDLWASPSHPHNYDVSSAPNSSLEAPPVRTFTRIDGALFAEEESLRIGKGRLISRAFSLDASCAVDRSKPAHAIVAQRSAHSRVH
jgi:hypothetical protein